jgi:hypothetical protein
MLARRYLALKLETIYIYASEMGACKVRRPHSSVYVTMLVKTSASQQYVVVAESDLEDLNYPVFSCTYFFDQRRIRIRTHYVPAVYCLLLSIDYAPCSSFGVGAA